MGWKTRGVSGLNQQNSGINKIWDEISSALVFTCNFSSWCQIVVKLLLICRFPSICITLGGNDDAQNTEATGHLEVTRSHVTIGLYMNHLVIDL